MGWARGEKGLAGLQWHKVKEYLDPDPGVKFKKSKLMVCGITLGTPESDAPDKAVSICKECKA